MWREHRAVVFDMDDTLYPYRRFQLSGFAAVADYLDTWHGVHARGAYWVMATARRGPWRGRELQKCLRVFSLPDRLLPRLLTIFERHDPRLRLPRVTTKVLEDLRAQGWRLAVLTNGPRARQARRVRALGLAPLVDAVVFATDFGSGKPDTKCFAEALHRLDVSPGHALMVGDDEACDIAGARAVGLYPVRCAVWTDRHAPVATRAAAVIRSFDELRWLASSALEDLRRHVA